jgi:hypothetical protein
MLVVLIIGPPGVGKTSTLTALEDLLTDRDVRHAAVEVEALSWAHPPLSDPLTFRNVAAIRDAYAEAGYDLLVCGATVTSEAYLEGLFQALRPAERIVVRLDADEPTLRERIERREPPEWSGLAGLLSAVGELAAISRSLENIDAVYSTTDLSPDEIALRVNAEVVAARVATR